MSGLRGDQDQAMANPKDETGKGSPRPVDAGAGKRPYATLDLQATEVPGQGKPADADAAQSGQTSAEAKPGPRAAISDAAQAAARHAAALVGRMQSGSFLSHMGAGVLGALVVGLVGYLLMPVQSIDPKQAIDVHNLARRLADAEAVLGMSSGDSNGLVARTDELTRSVRELGEAQTRLAGEAKALEGRLGTGPAGNAKGVPTDLAARLAKVEQSLAAQAGTEPAEATKAAIANFDRELAGIRTEAVRLAQRVDTLRTDVEERLRGVVRSADLTTVQTKLAGLDKELQAMLKTEGDRSANATRAVLSLELASLRRVMDRGEPFTNELAAVRRASSDKLDLKPLERYMRDGVPPVADITKSFRKITNAMQDAESVPPDASLVERLLSGAKSIVRVRKAGHSPDDDSLDALTARMDTALKDGRLAEVLEQGKKLPPKAEVVAADWLRQVEARHAVDRAMADIEESIKSSLIGRPRSTEQRQ
jgi:hypothetical protein